MTKKICFWLKNKSNSLQVENPFCFSGVVIKSSDENCQYKKLEEDINCFYESKNINQVNSSELSKNLVGDIFGLRLKINSKRS